MTHPWSSAMMWYFEHKLDRSEFSVCTADDFWREDRPVPPGVNGAGATSRNLAVRVIDVYLHLLGEPAAVKRALQYGMLDIEVRGRAVAAYPLWFIPTGTALDAAPPRGLALADDSSASGLHIDRFMPRERLLSARVISMEPCPVTARFVFTGIAYYDHVPWRRELPDKEAC